VATITATDPSTTVLPGTAVLTVTSGTMAPTLTMTPASGGRKALVTITGTGYMAGHMATITYMSGRKKPKRASSVLCTGSVASDGTFSCSGVIPRRLRAGTKGQKSIVGTDSGGTVAKTIFNLT
jgi:hypothetical protein